MGMLIDGVHVHVHALIEAKDTLLLFMMYVYLMCVGSRFCRQSIPTYRFEWSRDSRSWYCDVPILSVWPKKATAIAVRVLDQNGSGTTAGVIRGIVYVAQQHSTGEKSILK